MAQAGIQELRDKLRALQSNLEGSLLLAAERVADVARVLAERNAHEQGFGAQYSKNEVPAFWFEGKELNAGGRSAIEKAKKANNGLLSWGGFREAQGLPVAFVDLTYSGEMWRGMRVVEVRREGDKFVARLGHTNKEGQNKMNWNAARYGGFFLKLLTQTNRDFLAKYAADETVKAIKQTMG